MSNGNQGSNHVVGIKVSPEGNIRYDWAVLHVNIHDTITWRFAGEFTVHFPETPFNSGQLAVFGRKVEGQATLFEATSTDFSADARGVYRYHVALRPEVKAAKNAKTASQIFLDVGCPEIIVGR